VIIGINGFKGAGKDTVADYLVSKYGFEKASFAALLKQSVAALFGISLDDIERWKNSPSMTVKIVGPSFPMARDIKTHSQLTFRQFLQRYGTEAHREIFGYDFWVNNLMMNLDVDKDYVIPDARFENELRAVRAFGGFNWCVERPGYEGEDHASEVAPDPDLIDYYIHNFHTPDFLHDQARQALKKARKLSGQI
jgi:hypothetical protein